MRLIDADNLGEITIHGMVRYEDIANAPTIDVSVGEVLDCLDDQDTLNPDETVHCKNCMRSRIMHEFSDNDKYLLCTMHSKETKPNGYCHWGKRREVTE